MDPASLASRCRHIGRGQHQAAAAASRTKLEPLFTRSGPVGKRRRNGAPHRHPWLMKVERLPALGGSTCCVFKIRLPTYVSPSLTRSRASDPRETLPALSTPDLPTGLDQSSSPQGQCSGRFRITPAQSQRDFGRAPSGVSSADDGAERRHHAPAHRVVNRFGECPRS